VRRDFAPQRFPWSPPLACEARALLSLTDGTIVEERTSTDLLAPKEPTSE
jgi:hypothetical protein